MFELAIPLQAGPIIRKRLGLPEGSLTVKHIQKAARWRKVGSIVKSFLGNSLHLLCKLSRPDQKAEAAHLMPFALALKANNALVLFISIRYSRKCLKV